MPVLQWPAGTTADKNGRGELQLHKPATSEHMMNIQTKEKSHHRQSNIRNPH